MQILIVGGFLGSGKTTLIRSILEALDAEGATAALIENEIGEVGIDDVVLQQGELVVKPLFGGCVCCEITGNLITTVQQIQKEINPDWVIVEMTGLALMDSIRESIEKYLDEDLPVHTVSVLDTARWEKLHLALSQIIENQIKGADVVVLNKEASPEVREAIIAYVQETAPEASLMDYSLDTESVEFWTALSEQLGTTQEVSA